MFNLSRFAESLLPPPPPQEEITIMDRIKKNKVLECGLII
jgi:hypothetical protein